MKQIRVEYPNVTISEYAIAKPGFNDFFQKTSIDDLDTDCIHLQFSHIWAELVEQLEAEVSNLLGDKVAMSLILGYDNEELEGMDWEDMMDYITGNLPQETAEQVRDCLPHNLETMAADIEQSILDNHLMCSDAWELIDEGDALKATRCDGLLVFEHDGDWYVTLATVGMNLQPSLAALCALVYECFPMDMDKYFTSDEYKEYTMNIIGETLYNEVLEITRLEEPEVIIRGSLSEMQKGMVTGVLLEIEEE